MKYYAILFLCMLFTSSVSFAQDGDVESDEQSSEYADENTNGQTYLRVNPNEVSQKKGYDTEQIRVRRFDRKKWEAVIGGNNYAEEQPPDQQEEQAEDSEMTESTNSKQRIKSNDDYEGSSVASDSTATSPLMALILQIIFYGGAIAILGYILFLVIKNISLKSRGKTISNVDAPDYTAPVEDIKELEIDRLLREAMTSGNYRLVVRIYFLGLLKKLDEDGFIVWKKDKTNRDYLSELFSKAHYYDEIKNLTLAYELVWYGDHNLPVPVYEQIISLFKAIDQKLKASKAL